MGIGHGILSCCASSDAHGACARRVRCRYAIRYSDKSPLEMHHLATGFACIQSSGVLSHLPLETRKRIRERVIAMVLATDFTLHMKILNEYKALLEPAAPGAAAKPGAATTLVGRTRADAAQLGKGVPVFSARGAGMTEAEATSVACMAIKVACRSDTPAPAPSPPLFPARLSPDPSPPQLPRTPGSLNSCVCVACATSRWPT